MRKHIIFLFALLAFQAVSFAQTAGQRDTLVNLPWGVTKSYATTTGKVITVYSDEIQRNGVGDLRNRMTGLVPGLDIVELSGGIYQAADGGFTTYNAGGTTNNFRINGFNNMKILVDGIPIPFNQLLLESNQLESVTVLTDILDKAKAGPMASFGALLIKTRRGQYNTPLKITTNVETGMNFVDNIPEWASGADYAKLNNISRIDAGLEPLYTDEAIAAFKRYKENDLLYPAVNYREKMIRNSFSSTSFGLDMTAGSNTIKYHVALNGMNYNDILKSDRQDYNKINLTANVTTKIGQYLEASAGFMGLLSFRRYATGVGWSNFRSVPEIAYPLVLGKVGADSEDADIAGMTGRTIYGVSKTFTGNYYAKMLEGGTRTYRNRSGMFHADMNLDLSFLLPGLRSKTSVLATSFLSTTIGKNNDYIAYFWDPTEGIQQISDTHKGARQASRSMAANTTSSTLSLYERLDYDWAKNGHLVNAGLTYYQSSAAQTGDSYAQRIQYLEGEASWSYRGRYNLEVAAQYDGSSRFKGKARWGFFPTVGASWIATNEEFLKDNSVLTLLKLYGQGGKVGTAELFGSPYLYQAIYSLSGSIEYGPSHNAGAQWFGNSSMSSTQTTLSRLANEALTWTEIFQVGAGVDVGLFDCVTLSADVYQWKNQKQIEDILANTPTVFGLDATIYDNHNINTTTGLNLAIAFKKNWGDFRVHTWAGAYFQDQVYTKLVTDNYLYDYQKKTGASSYAIRGYVCQGKYKSQEEIDALPSYVDKSNLMVGDLKYKDLNDDGTIDANDQMIIGRNTAKMAYAVNLDLGWKNFDLLVVGTGRMGQDVDLSFSTYFTGATGMANQSQFVVDELGKTLPRLSYYGVPNNNLTSTYWLRKGDWFKIQCVDAGYTFKLREGNRLGLSKVRVDLKGSNLFTFKKLDYVDPEETSAGLSDYPYFKVVTLGAKLVF